MTTKNTKVLGCRVSLDIYDSFELVAKEKGLTAGEYLRKIVERGLEKHFTGLTPQKGEVSDSKQLSDQAIQRVNPVKPLPLIDKPVWYRKGGNYTPGQKFLVKQKNGGVVTVIAPELDGDDHPIPPMN